MRMGPILGKIKEIQKHFQLFSLVTEPLQEQGHTAMERREGALLLAELQGERVFSSSWGS